MTAARHRQRPARGGYSLVELLLTVALLLLFVGVGVISMQTMSQGAALSEGTLRFESVLRFARAEAARSGHRVRVSFVQDTSEVASATNQLSHVQLAWEPDPAGQPDVFQDMPASQWGVDQVNETVAIETVRMIDPAAEPECADDPDADPSSDSTNLVAALDPIDDTQAQGDADVSTEPLSITFNPDGSSDSAEVTLASRADGDDRRMVVRLEGFTGTVSRMDPPPEDGDVADASPASDQSQSSDLNL